MGRLGQHAVVIGASIAGLCAARVLSERYDRVTVYDRDGLPADPENRQAVPQGRHLHLLLARGAQELGELFPGLLSDMVAEGVPVLENQPECIHFGAAGHVLGTTDRLREGFTTYIPSRPQLEWQIRRRVQAIDNVDFQKRSVTEPKFDQATQRVTGVLVDTDGGEPEFVAADLVVDSTGRGTRLPVWLEKWGFERPRETTVDVGVTYATHRLRMPDGLITEKLVVNGAAHDRNVGLGLLLYEDATWILTTFGVAKEQPPQNFAEMCAVVQEILPPHIADAVRQSQPVGDIAFHKYPTSRWRRFDKLRRFPAGIVPVGDAVVSFNPTFGQGMTMSILQAANLRRALDRSGADPTRSLLKATAKSTYPVWMTGAVADLTMHGAEGDIPWWYPRISKMFDQFLEAAETEPVLAEWFLRRFSLLDSLWMVPGPSIVARTMRHNLRCWLAERKEAKQAAPDRDLVTNK
ncbi:oxidoreductase [Mycolicibacterium moriokaense]|nr:oxidoreductase [Mycolicibacterium moriokaense]